MAKDNKKNPKRSGRSTNRRSSQTPQSKNGRSTYGGTSSRNDRGVVSYGRGASYSGRTTAVGTRTGTTGRTASESRFRTTAGRTTAEPRLRTTERSAASARRAGGGTPSYDRSAKNRSNTAVRRTAGTKTRSSDSKIININEARARRNSVSYSGNGAVRTGRQRSDVRIGQTASYRASAGSTRRTSSPYSASEKRRSVNVGTTSMPRLTPTSTRNRTSSYSRTGSALAQKRRSPQPRRQASQVKPAGARSPQSRRQTVVREKVRGIGYEGAAKFFMVAFFALVILYLGGNLAVNAFKDMTTYDTVQIGSIDTPKSAEALIIRSEEVYSAGMDGVINFMIPDGDKVKSGDTICSIREAQIVDKMEKDLNDIEDDIISSESSKQEIDASGEEAQKYNMEIKTLVDDSAMSLAAYDTAALRDLTNNVNVKQEMRNQAILSGSTETELNTRMKNAKNVIAENSSYLTALSGGILSLETDGLENTLTPNNMENITESDINNNKGESHVAGQEVASGENVFKIVTSNVWYLAAYINSDYISDWKVGDTRTIYLKDALGESIEMDVKVSEIKASDKSAFIILQASKYIADFMDVRNLTFEIDKVKTGYKIPNTSIVENTLLKIPAKYVSEGFVTKSDITGGTTQVSVGEPNGDFAYFPVGYDSLVLHDMLINPEDSSDTYELTEVETRQGVYVMNSGIAEFYTIDMENSSSNSTHTILDPNKNRNINIYDRVVTDPKNIQDNEMLYK